ncbi:MAG: SurA N-terminal domain-containing protein, partial [Spirochaetes bacterium]|nr:SurA N-terminal domain-containing protein [Spirochaetota bacterium]
MKVKRFLSTAAAVTVSILFLISCGSNSDLAGGDWVAKINDDEITINMLNAYYYAQQKQIYNISNEEIDKLVNDPNAINENPTLDKEEFLENYIRQRLVYNKAIKEGMLNDPEVKAHIEMAKEAVVVAQYVKNKFKQEFLKETGLKVHQLSLIILQ